jgi:hypothetical protein
VTVIKGLGSGFPEGTVLNIYGRGDHFLGTTTVVRDRDMDEQFLDFHQTNPKVYETLVRLARDTQKRGHTRIGMKMLWEVMRWQLLMERPHDPESEFKLNNNLHSRYARLIMANEPGLKGFFETRRLKT